MIIGVDLFENSFDLPISELFNDSLSLETFRLGFTVDNNDYDSHIRNIVHLILTKNSIYKTFSS